MNEQTELLTRMLRVRVAASDLDRLRDAARADERTAGALVRRLIRQGLATEATTAQGQ